MNFKQKNFIHLVIKKSIEFLKILDLITVKILGWFFIFLGIYNFFRSNLFGIFYNFNFNKSYSAEKFESFSNASTFLIFIPITIGCLFLIIDRLSKRY